jgi:uncharacterized membrane protein
MAEADSLEIEARSADRVVVFSDAVVAIAITLLALDLPIPGLDDRSNRAVLDFLGDHWNAYFAFFISFVVISGHWGSHRAIFRYVNRINDKVIGINMVWLLMVVMTPFAARTLAASTRGFGVRFGIYALVQAVALTCLVRLGRELAQDHLLRDDAPESARHPDYAARYAAIASFLISIPVAFATPWAYAIWAAGPGIAARIQRARNRPSRI